MAINVDQLEVLLRTGRWRAAAAYIAAGAGGGYASLTGPGSASSPGELDQAGGFFVTDSAATGVQFTTNGGFTVLDSSSTTIIENNGVGGVIELVGDTAVAGSGHKIGFYGTTPVTRPARPVVLADVINALVALGLTS